ncbi:MAG: TatD family hydrolase [Gemmatimonadales bacterium]
MLIDTHCHLTDAAFLSDRWQAVERMRAAGVGRALVVESDLGRLDDTLSWAADETCLGIATGCHPHDARQWGETLAEQLCHAWVNPMVRAAGEIGLDYHYDRSPRDVQRRAFAEQLGMAVDARLPVVVHAREADDDVAAVLREQPAATIILHSFSSGTVLRDAGLANGWFFSFSGMVTFKSWTQFDTIRAVAADRLLIETDSPYLAPVPHRGRRNEPAFVVEVAQRLADIRGVPFDEIAAVTTANALRVFWDANPGPHLTGPHNHHLG